MSSKLTRETFEQWHHCTMGSKQRISEGKDGEMGEKRSGEAGGWGGQANPRSNDRGRLVRILTVVFSPSVTQRAPYLLLPKEEQALRVPRHRHGFP